MRQLMKSFENLSEPPRVIGLTATLLNGNCGPDKVIENVLALETTFHSKVATVDGLAQVVGYSTNPSENFKFYDNHILEPHEHIAINFLEKTMDILKQFKPDSTAKTQHLNLKGLRPLSASNGHKKVCNLLGELIMQVESMGSYGGLKATISQLIQVERMKKHCQEISLLRILNYVQTSLSFVKELLSNAMADLEEDQQIFGFSSNKILKLLSIFEEYKEKSEENLCCIVFTQKRFTAKVIFHILKSLTMCHTSYSHIKPDFLVGYSNNPQNETRENLYCAKKNKQVLQEFADKELNVLVATDVLEEGVDIPKCTLVIKFDKPEDYRSYIQSKGRARHKKSLYYMIVENGAAEKYQEKYRNFQQVEEILNNFLIGKNLERLDPSREDIERMYNENEICPYYVDGPESAQVNMQSAIPLLCQYCSSLPSDMYTLHAPEWYLKSNCESGEPDEKRFSIVIILPTICPILEAIEVSLNEV
ncbi:hypothetical protein JTB14_013589 [Gonioctena quinquepunctata]|nr:hypothetical protein JTB14_013589 [Gonioctena quinquepunctata]